GNRDQVLGLVRNALLLEHDASLAEEGGRVGAVELHSLPPWGGIAFLPTSFSRTGVDRIDDSPRGHVYIPAPLGTSGDSPVIRLASSEAKKAAAAAAAGG